jgi:hypothetical protein
LQGREKKRKFAEEERDLKLIIPTTMAKRQKKDLWWYIKKEYGISGLKRKFTKQTGIPLTKAGVERKLGALLLDWVLGRGKKAATEVEEVEEEEE